jgi:hypothetical protein
MLLSHFADRSRLWCGTPGKRSHRNQWRAVIAAPLVGENSIGIRLTWRSFQGAD